jgi:hypothetical protein
MKLKVFFVGCLFTLFTTLTNASVTIPTEAMQILGSFRGNYKPVNCNEKTLRDGVQEKTFACNSSLVQISYSHVDGIIQAYFFKNSTAQRSNLVYGRMVEVGQVGCRDMNEFGSTECFDLSPGFFAENVDYTSPTICGEQEANSHSKMHWELKRISTGLEMLVHEEIESINCKDNKVEAPTHMTKDLSVRLDTI